MRPRPLYLSPPLAPPLLSKRSDQLVHLGGKCLRTEDSGGSSSPPPPQKTSYHNHHRTLAHSFTALLLIQLIQLSPDQTSFLPLISGVMLPLLRRAGEENTPEGVHTSLVSRSIFNRTCRAASNPTHPAVRAKQTLERDGAIPLNNGAAVCDGTRFSSTPLRCKSQG